MNRPLLTAAVMLGLLRDVRATRWVGPASTFGPVDQPASYVQAVDHLVREQYGFEDLGPGTSISQISLGSMSLNSSPALFSSVVAAADPVAGTSTSTGTRAAHVTQANGQPTFLTFQLDQPVISLAFVLMGLESAAWIEAFGGDTGTDSLGRYSIPAPGQPGVRRWIGIMEDERSIWKVRLEPTLSEDYAIDDVEIGVHAPEPASAAIWGLLACLGGSGVRRRMRP